MSQRLLYGRWTRPRSAGLGGMTFGTTIFVLASVVAAFLVAMMFGAQAAVVAAVILALVNIPLIWSRDGRSGWEKGIEMWQWRRARRRGENLYRGGRFSAIPGGAKIPGLLAPSKLFEDESASGFRFGMVQLPAKNHFSIVLNARAQGGEAVPQSVVDRWVTGWGQAIAIVGQASDVIAITAVVETLPETGQRLRNEIQRLRSDSAPGLAAAVIAETAELPVAVTKLVGRITITFKAEAGRAKNPEDQAAEISRQLPVILNHFDAAGVPVRPMRAHEIAALVRRSYTIGDYPLIEQCEITGADHGITWDQAGPVSQREESGYLDHDLARSITWEMAAPPAGAVDERVLTRLLAPTADAPYKRVAIVYRPHDAGVAVKISEDDYKNALVANQTQRGVGSAAAALRVEAAAASRTEQARGAALVQFGLLVTVTAPEGTDMPRLSTLVRGLSEASRLKIRLCTRFQAAAFAASMGVGVVLPEHATVSETLAG